MIETDVIDHLDELCKERGVDIILSNNEGLSIYCNLRKGDTFSMMSRKLFEEILSMKLKNYKDVKDVIINKKEGYSILSSFTVEQENFYAWVNFPGAFSMRNANYFFRNLKRYLKRKILENSIEVPS